MGSMRLLPMGFVIVGLSLPVLAQTAAPVTPDPPVPPPLLRQFLSTSQAKAPELRAPKFELKFPHWRGVPTKSEPLVQFRAQPGAANPTHELIASATAIPRQCSIPLIAIPLPEHFDDGMVHTMGHYPDDRIAMPTPPVCPLRSATGNPQKLK